MDEKNLDNMKSNKKAPCGAKLFWEGKVRK